MSRGRPPAGPQLVERLEGEETAKRRLEAILETIAGRCTIADASARLDLRPARFFRMRNEAMQAALERLEPRPCGRKRKQVSPEAARIEELERELAQAQRALALAELRAQTALLLPRSRPAPSGPDACATSGLKKTTRRRSPKPARRRARSRR